MGKRTTLIYGLFFLSLASCLIMAGPGQAEDYSLQYEEIFDDPEAQVIVRYGDVDNMGFGWPENFDPFSGNSTPPHGFPWTVDPEDADGTDRIMVVSSYNGSPPNGEDGYTTTTSRPENEPREIRIHFSAPNPALSSAVLQIFVDDFQSPVWSSRFQVSMNGIRVQELEDILNSLNQTGPVGKLITFQIPDRVIANMQNNELNIFVDDPTTGAGDGFAFDFFRLLINPGQLQNTGMVSGYVYDAETREPISGAAVSSGVGSDVVTDASGYYELQNAPAGLAVLTAYSSGYTSKTSGVDLIAGETATLDFYLELSDVAPCDCADTDEDGVADAWDRCSDTPLGMYVDRYGCPAPEVSDSTCDINDDGKTGLEEAIHALQVAAGTAP